MLEYMGNIRKNYRQIKTAIRKKGMVDTYFVSKYSFSPYMACEHACKYCDGRAEKYYVEGDYEKDIVIRKNLPEILKMEIPKLREIGTIMIGSGISDSYQPVEADEKLMRRSAEILLESNLSVAVLTKSSLIMRDLDIWKKVNQKNGFTLMISLITLDDHIRQVFEPNASPVQERLDTLSEFRKEGIPVGVLAMPILPFISDTKEQVTDLISELENIGVDFVMPGSLTLRPGVQKETYLKIIKEHYPQKYHDYVSLYKSDRASGNPDHYYGKQFFDQAYDVLNSRSILSNIPHQIFQNRFPIYDEINILMSHMIELYSRKGINVFLLKSALSKYRKWLFDEKKIFNRKRKLTYQDLDWKLIDLFKTDRFNEIINNRKLFTFLEKIVIDRKTFDYRSLKAVNGIKEKRT